jgi:hypothetical protein
MPLTAMVMQACANQIGSVPIPVEIVTTEQGYELLRNREPYAVRGAGGDLNELESLVRNGGNSIRTWHVETDRNKGLAFLDRAHSLGITVSLCLNIARERQGFDYDDPKAVARQYEQARAAVLSYRDHPALLSWIIGNELNYDFKNLSVYNAVNDISLMIHKLDPFHPTTTTIAGFNGKMIQVIEERAPDLDFISVQMYGDLINLPRYLEETQYGKPYFVTEWGSVGHWEVEQTEWGAPIEMTSTQKAENYLRGYEQVIAVNPNQGLGDYVFLWGQKQEKTPTWYGVFTETGEATQAVDVMHYVWTGKWPKNRSPAITEMQLVGRSAAENIYLSPGQTAYASLVALDPDGDPLSYQWSIKRESGSTGLGGDFEAAIRDIEGLIEDPHSANIAFTAPDRAGPYRIFVYAYDRKGKAAHANIPFFVKQQ